MPLTPWAIAAEFGASDCETIREDVLAQPANTISSAAYVVVGLLLVLRALRHRGEDAWPQAAYGLALGGVGIGSIAFHGPRPSTAQLLHDGMIVAAFAVITAHALGTLLHWPPTWRVASAGLVTAIDAVLLEVWRPVGLGLAGLVAIVGVVVEVDLHRRGRRQTAVRELGLLGVALGLLAVAVAANLLGRTGGPLCRPESLLQGHAIWHTLTAGAFGLYGVVVFSPPERQQAG